MDDNDQLHEIRASFFVECDELLEALQDGLEAIKRGEASPELINDVFRSVHSIKGGAGALKMNHLVAFTHGFETMLDAARTASISLDAHAIDLCFAAADHLQDMVAATRSNADWPSDASSDLLKALSDLCGKPTEDSGVVQVGNKSTPRKSKTYLIEFKPYRSLYDTGNEPSVLLRQLALLGQIDVELNARELPDITDIVPEHPYLSWVIHLTTTADIIEVEEIFEFVDGLCDLAIDVQIDLPIATEDSVNPLTEHDTSSQAHQKTSTNSVVRVELERVERLVNLVGELVINQAMLSQSLENSGLSPHSDAIQGLEDFQRLTRDIQESVMMIRAQPIKSLFHRMARIVRESGATVKKDVQFSTSGEQTEIDKTALDRLTDPLTHMLRNAVDHGLEDPETRKRLGKPEQGNIRLDAYHKSGRVILEISDDGAGLDREAITAKAVANGLISQDAELSEPEIDNLLFAPGFSTAAEVTDLSGRGVGLDVVKTAIQSLGGKVMISSSPGNGTTFTISLPLTLAVLEGMIVDVAQETLVVPLNLVQETFALDDAEFQSVRPGSKAIRVREQFVPVFDLGAMLGFRAELERYDNHVALMVARDDGECIALVIDDIRDQRQVVIKGLGDDFYKVPGVSAATILGDGQIALIVDPTEIMATRSTLKPKLAYAGAEM